MYEVTVTAAFSAAHALRLPDSSLEPVHGHDWRLSVTAAAEGLDAMGAVMDFHDLQDAVDSAVTDWRNADLNQLAPFAAGVKRGDDGSLEPSPDRAWNPTAERVCQEVAVRVGPTLPPGVRLASVSVTEAIGCAATFRP